MYSHIDFLFSFFFCCHLVVSTRLVRRPINLPFNLAITWESWRNLSSSRRSRTGRPYRIWVAQPTEQRFFSYLANISNSVNSFFFFFSFLLVFLVFLSCFLLCNFTITVSYSFDDMKTFRLSSIIRSDIVLPYIALAPPQPTFLALNKSEHIKELMSFTCRLTIEVHIRVSSQGLTGSSPRNDPFFYP